MSEQTEPTPAPSRTGQAGATAHDAGVATSSNPPAAQPRSVAAGDVPSAELCWLEFNSNTSSWEVWTSRDARRLFLFSSGRDHAQALVDLDIYEEAERELRQANQP